VTTAPTVMLGAVGAVDVMRKNNHDAPYRETTRPRRLYRAQWAQGAPDVMETPGGDDTPITRGGCPGAKGAPFRVLGDSRK